MTIECKGDECEWFDTTMEGCIVGSLATIFGDVYEDGLNALHNIYTELKIRRLNEEGSKRRGE